MARTIDTDHLRVAVDALTATWSVAHKPSRCRLPRIRPAFAIKGLPVDLASYKATVAVRDVHGALGSFRAVELTYEKRRGLTIAYTLSVSRDQHDILVELGFTNHTGRTLVVDGLKPIVADAATLGGGNGRWKAIGDGKTFHQPYQSRTVASMRPLHCWWHAAVKNLDTGRSILLGSLTNHKGSGRFTLAARGKRSMDLTAWCDYESIAMPPGATIGAEKVLLNFSERGTDGLLRFGDLIARAHDIDLARLAPLDPDDASIATMFNHWNSYGAGVVRGFKYSHDASKHKRAFQDPEWRRKNQRLFHQLGIHKFIHPDLPKRSRPHGGGVTPLVRNYGQPDWWFPAARKIFADHPELYINKRIDFSNPKAQALERQRAESLFTRNEGKLVGYGADFTDRWSRLPGQHDPFMTSVETFRAAMRPWRQLQRKHTGGCYARVCMNSIGFSYDVWDILRIGGDSDQAYHGRGCTFVNALIRQASGRFFYSGKVWWNNPDSFHVYCQGIYTHAQAKVHASFCAIAGNRMMVSEPFCDQTLPPDRLEIIKRVMPATPDTAIAVDCFEHNPARLWHLPIRRPFGAWSIVGLFNFNEKQDKKRIRQTIRFADLGLDPAADHLVYEFWSKAFLGVKRGAFTRTLDAPDCEIYAIVPRPDRPVLLSTSRHVRHMAYDIVALAWHPAARRLTGTSRVVAADPYQLRLYVPDGYQLSAAKAGDLKLRTARQGPLLTLDLTPNAHGTLDWHLAF